ncbi:MAG TPA: hypothetical protein VEZ41_06610, partial [Allosphingosinicella sp.]|nr:hypothetical protein [Allosphingosinicella sp.]
MTDNRLRLVSTCAAAALAAALLHPGSAHAQAFRGDPSVVGGSADFDRSVPGKDRITLRSRSAVINWNPRFSSGTVVTTSVFLPAGHEATFVGEAGFAVLNRIIPVGGEPFRFDGAVLSRLIDAETGLPTGTTTGTVAFYTPNGLIIGPGATFDVGSLILTTLDPFVFDTEGGTFIDGSGSIFFGSTEVTGSYVQTLSGSQITAAEEGSFVIMAAPRVEHGGSVRVNGSAAYVAGNGAFVRYDAGLFDIFISGGSEAATPLVHSGTTGGPASSGAGDAHRIYMSALSEDRAMTALIGGNVGFDAPLNATVENGAIILSAEARTFSDDPSVQANLNIVDGTFTSDVEGVSSHNVTAAGTISFSRDVTLAGPRSVAMVAEGPEQLITVGRNLYLGSRLPDHRSFFGDGTGGAVLLSALSGGRIVVGANATLDASGIGTSFSGETEFVSLRVGQGLGSGVGGTANVVADAGTIEIGGNLEVLADGIALSSEFAGEFGGSGVGGSANLRASSLGSISVGRDLTVSAEGRGAAQFGGDPAALGAGGTIVLTGEFGGQIAVAGTSTLSTVGTGGESFAGDGTGGIGAGGSIVVQANGGRIDLAGGTEARADGIGAHGATGGSGVGGSILVQASGGGVVQTPALSLSASGTGADAFHFSGGNGGSGIGGDIAVRASAAGGAGTINTGALSASAGGTGGTGSEGSDEGPAGDGGAAEGGMVELTADDAGGRLAAGATTASATAIGGAGGLTFPGGVEGAGGRAIGGVVVAGTRLTEGGGNGGQATFSNLNLSAAATGGAGSIGGVAEGGTAALRSAGGSTTIAGSATIGAAATGGAGRTAGSAQGGTAQIDAVGGSLAIAGLVNVDAGGTGGATPADGVSGGSGSGGTASILASGSETIIQLSSPAVVQATGTGGASQSATPLATQTGGAGTGGT